MPVLREGLLSWMSWTQGRGRAQVMVVSITEQPSGEGPCKGSRPASAESRASAGTRAEAWDFVHAGVEILCDRREGPGAVLTCSSGRRLAP